MKANYHTHTWRCMHASGSEKEYVEQAIKGGLKILGFSDHSPYPFPQGYTSTFRMGMNQLEDYVDTILSLKKEYSSDIEIHLGLEVEYYPLYFPKLLDFVSDYPIEYFLLAQHLLGNEINEIYCGERTDSAQTLICYCQQVAEAMETGRFTYLAHPDLINYVGDTTLYAEQMRTLCQNAKKHSLPLEINLLGLGTHRNYPNELFWKIAGEEGCDVILGIDAHSPENVWKPEVIQQAELLVQKYNLHLLETAQLHKPV